MNDETYYRNILHDYAEGALAQDVQADVARHLAGCTECRKELGEIQALFSRTASLPRDIEPGRDLWEGIASRIPLKQPVSLHQNLGEHSRMDGRTRMPDNAPGRGTGRNPASPWTMPGLGQWLFRTAAALAVVFIFGISFWLATRYSGSPSQAARLDVLPQIGAIATDPGSAYSLQVQPNGDGFLQVTTGWVDLDLNGRKAIVPAGSMCQTKPGVGPGTPCRKDASPVLKTALAMFDFENGGSSALNSVLSASQPEDYITLWNLLFRAQGDDRCKTYDRLASLIPPPAGVTRDGFLGGDAKMVDAWKKQLNIAMIN